MKSLHEDNTLAISVANYWIFYFFVYYNSWLISLLLMVLQYPKINKKVGNTALIIKVETMADAIFFSFFTFFHFPWHHKSHSKLSRQSSKVTFQFFVEKKNDLKKIVKVKKVREYFYKGHFRPSQISVHLKSCNTLFLVVWEHLFFDWEISSTFDFR